MPSLEQQQLIFPLTCLGQDKGGREVRGRQESVAMATPNLAPSATSSSTTFRSLGCQSATLLLPDRNRGRFHSKVHSSRVYSTSNTRLSVLACSSFSNSSSSDPSSKIAATTTSAPTSPPEVTVQRDIPGSYGLPVLGSIQDRFNYFWFQGTDKFFRSRIQKYKSTVFRVNMPPGSPFFPDPRCVVLLDLRSFPVLFDVSKVSKRDVFTGTYKPSAEFNGGYRILSYLDVDEPQHAKLKAFCLDMLKSRGPRWIPVLHSSCEKYFTVWEEQLKAQGEAELNCTLELLSLSFLTKSLLDHDATAAAGTDGLRPEVINKWLAPQIVPLLNCVFGIPPVDELLFHTFPLPFALVKNDYKHMVDYFSAHSAPLLEMAETQHGVQRDEALHNLIFFVCFNTFGGLARLFPSALYAVKYLSESESELRSEVRSAVASCGGSLGLKALEKMPLLQSFVYEVLRFQPPVPYQYGRARKDMVIESHKEAFRVKAGEMLCGYQPIVTHDPEVFNDPDKFRTSRFLGEEGSRLLKYVVWSNGPETDNPSIENKQCAGKNFIVLITRLFLAEFFLRFDSFELQGPVQKGPSQLYYFKSLSKSA